MRTGSIEYVVDGDVDDVRTDPGGCLGEKSRATAFTVCATLAVFRSGSARSTAVKAAALIRMLLAEPPEPLAQ